MPYKDPEKKREYQRKWYAKRRSKWLADNGPCVECGSDIALQVDHVVPSDKVSHRLWSWSQVRMDKELSKCQVLCECCHLAKTIRAVPKSPHGALWRYQKGCRCTTCKDAKSEHDKTRRPPLPTT